MQTRKSKRGFVQFIKKLEGKELKGDKWDLFSTKEAIGCELYQRYAGLLEHIAGELDWDGFVYWVLGLSDSQRQDCRAARLSLGIPPPTNSLGVYDGDRSSTLGAAVEYILQHHQSQQQDDVSPRASGERLDTGSEDYY